MSTVALFNTENDYRSSNYTWEVSIVEYMYKKSENKLVFRTSFTDNLITVTDAKAINVRYLDSGDVRIAIIGE